MGRQRGGRRYHNWYCMVSRGQNLGSLLNAVAREVMGIFNIIIGRTELFPYRWKRVLIVTNLAYGNIVIFYFL